MISNVTIGCLCAPRDLPIVTTTWNPSDKGAGLTLSAANMKVTHDGTGATYLVRGTNARASTKRYMEFVIDSAPNLTSDRGRPAVGMANATPVTDGGGSIGGQLGLDAGSTTLAGSENTNGFGLVYDGVVPAFGTVFTGGSSFVVGDVIGMAVNFGSTRIWFATNGTWGNSGNPAAGTGGVDWAAFVFAHSMSALFSGPFYPAMSCAWGGAVTLRCKLASFSYTRPTGFFSWDGD